MNLIAPSNFTQNPDYTNLRLLFLDVDGVLNSYKTFIFAKGWPDHNCNWKPGESYLIRSEAFDKYAIWLVNQLCKVTGTFIVLSTSWRSCYPELDNVIKMMSEIGICEDYIIGRTDSHYVKDINRGSQISRYLGRIQGSIEERDMLVGEGLLIPSFAIPDKVSVENYAIVDDLDGEEIFDFQKKFTVKTDDYEGLTLRNALKLGEILTCNPTFHMKWLQGKPYATRTGYMLMDQN
jgi:hypothetical protein